ncbi:MULTISPECIES: UPF0149 family protein [Pasteurellaceae]|uniref:UPF0149 family protein n=1 Tax=Pasteurella atlantica TaxID=2827233 RepID=A0AAW8CSP8_9PAST|nr:UPF0149 family protein [Pasteurella atlantica]MBR0574552.1 UPF0149 family protein [Pasteurella atlantica]MDP8040412.1 UPF0149 family protein [Pasteurella atlantica]MDP8042578.1 UPF0149 family protein [Pasteurella atlantica]MDP8044680.1 UPF0149 family protein [Pasteurella atlantica]MDP8046738.1 UPF0149 family protein [Pasteurella atlantica]
MTTIQVNRIKKLLSELQVDYTVAELHGFLGGLIAGGIKDDSWKVFFQQFINDGNDLSPNTSTKLTTLYTQLIIAFKKEDVLFSLWLPQDKKEIPILVDGIGEWTSNFMLGLGLAQPYIQKEVKEINEVLNDLSEISKLSYCKEDDPIESVEAAEEILDYLHSVTLFLYNHFSSFVLVQTRSDNNTP